LRGLEILLKGKIVITAILWCLPLLTFPASWFVALGVPSPEPIFIARLLGAAYLALLVGYYAGLRGLAKGESPLPVMHMGIASNGFAAAILVCYGATGAWSSWGMGASVFMWLSTMGAFSITATLVHFRLGYAPGIENQACVK
jgi:hypothetical protein